jgi:hypothetical protein
VILLHNASLLPGVDFGCEHKSGIGGSIMSYRIWGSSLDVDQESPVVSLDDYLELPGLFKENVISHFKGLRLHVDMQPFDFFRIGLPLIFSGRLMEVVRPYCIAVEFLPVSIEVEGVCGLGDTYFLANIMDSVDCLDLNNGQYTYWENGVVDEIKLLALDESKMNGHNLFWVERAPPILLCASQTVQDSVRKEKFTGIGFRDPAKWKIMSEWQ